MDNNIVTVTTKAELKQLYDWWAMTWEGLVEDDFQEALKMCGGKGAKGYLVRGSVMNEICHLTGDNAYPDDLSIFAIYPYKGLAISVGARWMYDIIDNNARREGYHPFAGMEEDDE